MKKRLITILLLMIIVVSLTSEGVFGLNLSIRGPKQVVVKVGSPVKVNYSVYADSYKIPFDTSFRIPGAFFPNPSPVISGYSYSKMISGPIRVYERDENVNINGDFYILGIKPGQGSFIITASENWKDDNGRFYYKEVFKKVYVSVINGNELCLNGYLGFYNSGREFYATISNYSSKTVTMLPTRAKVVCKNKKNNRKLRLKNNKKITIKPGKTKSITFRVTGYTTKKGQSGYYIQCKCSYRGKKYSLRIYENCVKIKKKGRWQNTMGCNPGVFLYDLI